MQQFFRLAFSAQTLGVSAVPTGKQRRPGAAKHGKQLAEFLNDTCNVSC
jgi:hypothetical protein